MDLSSLPASPETARTSLNSMAPFSPAAAFSILTTSPGATRYCFPPVRMTAYILPPASTAANANLNLSWADTCSLLCGALKLKSIQGVSQPFLYQRIKQGYGRATGRIAKPLDFTGCGGGGQSF